VRAALLPFIGRFGFVEVLFRQFVGAELLGYAGVFLPPLLYCFLNFNTRMVCPLIPESAQHQWQAPKHDEKENQGCVEPPALFAPLRAFTGGYNRYRNRDYEIDQQGKQRPAKGNKTTNFL